MTGTVGVLVADYSQWCQNCQHGGMNARICCPTCTVDKATRLCPPVDLRCHRVRRTDAMMQVCRDQIAQESIETGVREVALHWRYGMPLKALPRPLLEPLGVCTLSVSFRDYEHLFHYGIFVEVLAFLFSLVGSKKNKLLNVELRARLNCFNWSGAQKIPDLVTAINKKAASQNTMKGNRNLMLAATVAFQGQILPLHPYTQSPMPLQV